MADAPAKPKSVVKITSLHHAGIPCNNLDRAVEFYTNVLGMEYLGQARGSQGRGHFMGTRMPADVTFDAPDLEKDFEDYLDLHRRVRGSVPEVNFVRMWAGNEEVVLFERPVPLESDTLADNGIFHQSFRISQEDMDRLTEIKKSGDSDIKFHTGPTVRWPDGWALYLWDSEGNYIELESDDEELFAKFGKTREPTSTAHAN
ncbi:MAG: hypothetical protein HW416_3287 [Chloroflexi bacterium]|nr:hypothetical protein [Chloroflexota bacterium]